MYVVLDLSLRSLSLKTLADIDFLISFLVYNLQLPFYQHCAFGFAQFIPHHERAHLRVRRVRETCWHAVPNVRQADAGPELLLRAVVLQAELGWAQAQACPSAAHFRSRRYLQSIPEFRLHRFVLALRCPCRCIYA